VIDRLLIVGAILLACAAGYLLVRGYLALRRRAVLQSTPRSIAGSIARMGSAPDARHSPTLVCFSTAECVQCRDQARAIAALECVRAGQVAVRKVDALAEPDLAEAYGVLTVPTTVVLDARARPRAVNYGFAPVAKLETQVREALAA
jgi:thioredoxin 1